MKKIVLPQYISDLNLENLHALIFAKLPSEAGEKSAVRILQKIFLEVINSKLDESSTTPFREVTWGPPKAGIARRSTRSRSRT